MSKTYPDRIRGDLLSEWRISQQRSASDLATAANLSEAQIRQLESGGSNLFYTPLIKEAAARKVARLLGADPDEVIRTSDDAPTPVAPLVLEELVALSCKKSRVTSSWSFLWRHPVVVFAPVVLLLGVIASGWLQEKWRNGGEQQFWRSTSTDNESPSMMNAWAAPAPSVLVDSSAAQPLVVPAQANTPARDQVDGLLPVAPPETTGLQAALPVVSSPENNKLCQAPAPDTVLTPSRPSKAGNMVHIVAYKAGVVCVEDAAGARTLVSLKTQEARSIYGKPPWRIHFELPEQAQLYFQGVRLNLPHPELMTVALHEAPSGSQ